MPRPPKLAYPRVIPIVMEQDMIDILKDLSEKTGKSISEIVRLAVEEYLIKEGYLKLEKTPVAGGLTALQVAEEKLALLRANELGVEITAFMEQLQRKLPKIREKRAKDLYYCQDKERFHKAINSLKNELKKLKHPPEKLTKLLLEAIDFASTLP